MDVVHSVAHDPKRRGQMSEGVNTRILERWNRSSRRTYNISSADMVFATEFSPRTHIGPEGVLVELTRAE